LKIFEKPGHIGYIITLYYITLHYIVLLHYTAFLSPFMTGGQYYLFLTSKVTWNVQHIS